MEEEGAAAEAEAAGREEGCCGNACVAGEGAFGCQHSPLAVWKCAHSLITCATHTHGARGQPCTERAGARCGECIGSALCVRPSLSTKLGVLWL